MSRQGATENKVYVGDLPRDASEKEIERAFVYYGPLRSVWVARNPPGFAFVEYEDPRDADDAVRGMDGNTVCGSRVRVEHARGKSRSRSRGSGGGDRWSRGGAPRGGRRFETNERCYECGERGHLAFECRRYRNSKRRSRSPKRSVSRSRSRSPSRSRSGSRDRSRTRSRSGSKDRAVPRRSASGGKGDVSPDA